MTYLIFIGAIYVIAQGACLWQGIPKRWPWWQIALPSFIIVGWVALNGIAKLIGG